MNPDTLRHGGYRDVHVSRLATNALDILSGRSRKPQYPTLLSVEEIGQLALDRWVRPRAERRDDFPTLETGIGQGSAESSSGWISVSSCWRSGNRRPKLASRGRISGDAGR